MKYVTAYVVASQTLNIQQQKPFNPILGETLQCHLNGVPVYLEQISHHPPVTAFYVPSPSYTMHGTFSPNASLSANSCTCNFNGSTFFEFKDSSGQPSYSFEYKHPNFIIHNTAIGKNYLNFSHKSFLVDQQNERMVTICYAEKGLGGLKQKSKAIDEIYGGIYQVTPEAITRLLGDKKHPSFELNHKTELL